MHFRWMNPMVNRLGVTIVALGAFSFACGPGGGGDTDPGSVTRADTLVLHDTTGQWGWLGEMYAVAAGHLASRFGTWEAKAVGAYRAGDMEGRRAVVYVGSTYDEPLPAAFLDDVLSRDTPVLWLGSNVWQLARRDGDFS